MRDEGGPSFVLSGARIVTADAMLDGAVVVRDGVIEAVEPGRPAGQDLDGDLLIPGIVDLHTDHVETHVIPRSGVQWPFLEALAAHDAVVVSGGTTTVFDSLSVGATLRRPERREILGPLVEALTAGRRDGLFRAEHLLHLRCEICDPATPRLMADALPAAHLVSVMDHTPGDRQSVDVERWLRAMIRDLGVDEAEGRELMAELLQRSARVGADVRAAVVQAAGAAGLPAMSHDDRTAAHVEQSVADGIAVAEFPTTLDAARRASALGQTIVAGAPNYLRGGSQSGNVAVADLLAEGLVDVLASDYVPRSPLDAALAIADDPALPHDLPAALALVTAAPARTARLADRGRIAAGLRADLVRVAPRAGYNEVRVVWVAGRRVY